MAMCRVGSRRRENIFLRDSSHGVTRVLRLTKKRLLSISITSPRYGKLRTNDSTERSSQATTAQMGLGGHRALLQHGNLTTHNSKP
jgi:hypothetical protein